MTISFSLLLVVGQNSQGIPVCYRGCQMLPCSQASGHEHQCCSPNYDLAHSCTCSVISDSATPWTVAHQASLSMRFSQQEYWSGLPCPPPGDLPNPGIEPVSLYVSCIGRCVLYHWRHLRSLSKSTHCSIYNIKPRRTCCGAQKSLLNIM